MKTTLLIFLISVINLTPYSHTKKNYFKVPKKIETNQYNLQFKDAIATEKECKLAVNIENKTNNILLLKYGESTFNLSGNEVKAKEKITYIYPQSSSKKVLRTLPGGNYLVDNFKLNFNGLYLISTSGKAEKAENFQLPAKENQITAGNFVINLLKLKQKTQETSAIFECKYIGSDYGIINPSKLSVTAKDKNGKDIEYANDNKKNKIKILKNGDSVKITALFHIEGRILDMQFATLFIKWNNTFTNTKSKKLATHNINFEIDDALTKEKN